MIDSQSKIFGFICMHILLRMLSQSAKQSLQF